MDEQANALLDDLAAGAGATRGQSGDSTEYTRAGRAFAVAGRDEVELRIGAEIGEAAMRTPSAGPSTHGPEWIRFAPPEWDQHAIDRLEAWFRVAWRMAEG
jgi:hypothetical protein